MLIFGIIIIHLIITQEYCQVNKDWSYQQQLTHQITCELTRRSRIFDQQVFQQLESRLAALETSVKKRRIDELNSTVHQKNAYVESRLMDLQLKIDKETSTITDESEALMITEVDALRVNLTTSLASKADVEEQSRTLESVLAELDEKINWISGNMTEMVNRYSQFFARELKFTGYKKLN